MEVPVIALGQRNGATAAVIQITNTSNNISISNLEGTQNIDNSCNTLKYNIQSHAVGTSQEMTLYAQGPCSTAQSNTLTVTVNIQTCPPGFQLSMNEPICICAERLQQFTNTCLVDNTTVLREHNAEFWVGYDSDNESRGLILHPNCPFDYCTSEETYLTVDDSDKQCNYNRSGLLCGRCSENLHEPCIGQLPLFAVLQLLSLTLSCICYCWHCTSALASGPEADSCSWNHQRVNFLCKYFSSEFGNILPASNQNRKCPNRADS